MEYHWCARAVNTVESVVDQDLADLNGRRWSLCAGYAVPYPIVVKTRARVQG